MSTRQLTLSQIVDDRSVYPRDHVNASNIAKLVDAIKVGAELPPIVVARGSWRIVDGVHRYLAYSRLLDASDKITVEVRSYTNDLEIFEDAARLNRIHGEPLQSRDLTRVALRLHEQDRSAEHISMVLQIPVSRVERILGRVVIVAENGEEHPVAASAPWWPTKGSSPLKLTPVQRQVAASSSGWRAQQTVRQLTREIEVGLHDHADEELWVLFRALADAIAAHDPGE